MPTYANGKIYTIRSRSRPDLVYVGSTTQPLSVRLGKHKSQTTTSRQIIDIGDAYIELYENHPCSNREELNRREGEVIRSMECVNRRIEGRSTQEYHREHREEISSWQQLYYTNNKDKIKQYQQDNADKISEQRKLYSQKNWCELYKYRRQLYRDKKNIQTCICGGKYNSGEERNVSRHYQTKKHQAHVETIYKKLRGEFN